MKILIVSATNFELNSIKEKIKSLNLKGFNFSFFCTGIGNFDSIYNLTKFLEGKDFDFVANFGICGYKNQKPDFVQIGRIFGKAKEKEFLVPQFINFGKISSILSSEKIIFEEKEIGEENFVDMESFGIEFVLEKTGIPRAFFKFPFDKIGSKDTKNFKEKLPEIKNILQENFYYEKFFQKVKNFLEKNNKKNFEKEFIFLEKNIGNFTFQEKNIFEKKFFEFETLVQNNIFDFLKNIFQKEKEFFANKKKDLKMKKKFLIEKI
ncbi:hypothetical protein LR002_02265, partial [Candidatus Gracilibacteria bacterium]|nr:hypothetical protein [Candidatus Gracilibacteria bacterium]